MYLPRIVAVALCVASLQLLAECSLSDKDRREIYREDRERAKVVGKDSYYSTEEGGEILESMMFGDTKSQADTAYKFLNNAWRLSKDSKRVLKALRSLKEYLAQHLSAKCDLNVYDQLLSIVRMSDYYFEEHTTRHALARMLLFRMHDAFVSNCVQKLLSELSRYHDKFDKEMGSLAAFYGFFEGEPLDLVPQETYPDNSPSMMDKLKLVANGDRAWYRLMKRATVEMTVRDEDRYKETWTMPRKQAMTVKFEYVVNNGCVLLSRNKWFQEFLDELNAVSNKFVFDLVDNEGLVHMFEEVERHLGMYKICMRVKDFDRNELMEKVELHTREEPAN